MERQNIENSTMSPKILPENHDMHAFCMVQCKFFNRMTIELRKNVSLT